MGLGGDSQRKAARTAKRRAANEKRRLLSEKNKLSGEANARQEERFLQSLSTTNLSDFSSILGGSVSLGGQARINR